MVVRALRPADVLGVIASAFVDPPLAPPRGVIESGECDGVRTLLTMPAMRPGGMSIVKVVNAGCRPNPSLRSHLLAFDQSGVLLAVADAHSLTAMRTAAASVLAARALGAGQARSLAILGAGRQARAHVEAYAAAMAIESLSIWARREEAAQALTEFSRRLVKDVRIARTCDEAVRGAEIVASLTPTKAPLIHGDQLSAGTHIDLVGGFRPQMREADDAVAARAIFVADGPAALNEAGDFTKPFADGILNREDVLLLADVLTGRAQVPPCELTVFKSVGHAGEDLVIAELLLARLGLTGTAGTECDPEKVAAND